LQAHAHAKDEAAPFVPIAAKTTLLFMRAVMLIAMDFYRGGVDGDDCKNCQCSDQALLASSFFINDA
jgi:hypothetical protein